MEQIGTRRNAWPTGTKPGFLELLSPPSSARVPFQPRLTPSDDSLSEFGQHLLAGLHDPKARSEIKDLHTALATELSQLNQYAINLAIQDLARESAQELARSLVARLRAKVGDQVETNKNNQPKKPDFATVSTPNQDLPTARLDGDNASPHAIKISGTVPEAVKLDAPNSQTGQLPNLAQAGGLRTTEATGKTIQPENEPSSKSSANSTLEAGVSRLPSYEFIIFAGSHSFIFSILRVIHVYLCKAFKLTRADSSGSRDSSSQRILAMKQAAQKMLKVATTINPKQRTELHFFDNPVTEPKLRRRSSAGAYNISDTEGFTAEEQVVGPLQEKVLKLLARKVAITEVDNRTIVIVITNGSVSQPYPPIIILWQPVDQVTKFPGRWQTSP